MEWLKVSDGLNEGKGRPNHSLPQKNAGFFVSGPGKRGELILGDPIPGR